MERRHFLKNTLATGSLIGLGGIPLTSCEPNSEKKVTILHTNDVHSHIESFPNSHHKYPNIGGVAKRASLIENVRSENPNTLLFDAGDIFQGTPYFNYFGGEVEFKMMSKLGYDASTIGNHDFDNSIDGLEKQLPHASFDFLIANYGFKNTILDGRTNPPAVHYCCHGCRTGYELCTPISGKRGAYPCEHKPDTGRLASGGIRGRRRRLHWRDGLGRGFPWHRWYGALEHRGVRGFRQALLFEGPRTGTY